MEHILKVSFTAMFSGVIGTGLGGLLGLVFKNTNNRIFAFILEFSAGLMLSVVCFSLIPDALKLSNIFIIFTGLFIGIIFAAFVQEKVHIDISNRKDTSYLTTGLLLAIALSAHNLPEGLAIGTGFDVSRSLGISLLLVILVHDVPEGIAVSLPLKKGGVSTLKAALVTAMTGLPMGIGAFIGAYLGYISDDIIALSLCIAGGTMLYISVGDIIPQSKKLYGGRFAAFGNCLGFLIGIAVSVMI